MLQTVEHVARIIKQVGPDSYSHGTCFPIEWKRYEKDKGLYRIYFLTVAHNLRLKTAFGMTRPAKPTELTAIEFFHLSNPKTPWLKLDHIWIEELHKDKDQAFTNWAQNPNCSNISSSNRAGS